MVNLRERVVLDWALVIAFALVAVTGLLLLISPGGRHRGWQAETLSFEHAHSAILEIHIVAGIIFVLLVLLHLAVNWACLRNMTRVAMGKYVRG